jgi:hypothetical protein
MRRNNVFRQNMKRVFLHPHGFHMDLRFRRFLRDWELFRSSGWPIVRYEALMEDERGVLQRACRDLGLEWEEGMISWPKPLSAIAYVGEPNKTFARSIQKGSLSASKLSEKAALRIDGLPKTELEWLEDTFSDYCAVHGYPARVPPPADAGDLVAPSYHQTSRYWYEVENARLWEENTRLREENERLQGRKRSEA